MQKKWFTLVEMLVVVIIIGILAAALLPKLMGAREGAKDIAPLTSVRNLTMRLAGNNYPPHLPDFSRKDYRINENDLAKLKITDMRSQWGKGSWVKLWNPTLFKEHGLDGADPASESHYLFARNVLSKIGQDILEEGWSQRDNQNFYMWFIGHLGNIVKGKDNIKTQLKNIGMNNIDKEASALATNKYNWAFFTLWTQKGEKNGAQKIDSNISTANETELFKDIINSNPELEGAYINMFFYPSSGNAITISEMFTDPDVKAEFVKLVVKDLISHAKDGNDFPNLSSGQ